MSTPVNPRKANLRLALVLAALAATFGLGFVAKIWLLGPY